MPIILRLIFVVLICSHGDVLKANDSAFVNLSLSPKLKKSKTNVQINDGINDHFFDVQDSLEWKGELFAPFGCISINYNETDIAVVQKVFFFKKGISKIILEQVKESMGLLKVEDKNLVNLIPYSKMGGDKYDLFIQNEFNARKEFLFKNLNKTGIDSIWTRLLQLTDLLTRKKIEFLKLNPNLYLSFWIFSHEIVKTDILKPDSLLSFYKKDLSENFRGSVAAEYIMRLLENKIAISTYGQVPLIYSQRL